MTSNGQTITDRMLRNVKYCRYMYGMFGVEIIGGEVGSRKGTQRAFAARCVLSDQIANIYIYIYIY